MNIVTSLYFKEISSKSLFPISTALQHLAMPAKNHNKTRRVGFIKNLSL